MLKRFFETLLETQDNVGTFLREMEDPEFEKGFLAGIRVTVELPDKSDELRHTLFEDGIQREIQGAPRSPFNQGTVLGIDHSEQYRRWMELQKIHRIPNKENKEQER